ncbi:hypothetical protein GGF32_007903 [Allomyces javanicus]|nr:hypothetical protein GGF32_007903 [Allomyces javanicus]
MAASTISTAFAKAKCSAEGLPEPDLLIRNSLKQPVGFCGPIPQSNGVYNEGGEVVTKDEATALYCNAQSQGDWRNWKSAGQCIDTGVRYPAGPDAPLLVVPKKAATSAAVTSTTTHGHGG